MKFKARGGRWARKQHTEKKTPIEHKVVAKPHVLSCLMDDGWGGENLENLSDSDACSPIPGKAVQLFFWYCWTGGLMEKYMLESRCQHDSVSQNDNRPTPKWLIFNSFSAYLMHPFTFPQSSVTWNV